MCILLLLPIISSSILGEISAPKNLSRGESHHSGSYYDGRVYTGRYIRVGINDYGALGVYDADLGAVGFQYPVGEEYESLAFGWWGDGWSLFYGNNSIGFSPEDDIWGSITSITPIVTVEETLYGYLHSIEMAINSDILLQFIIEFFNEKKYIRMETRITNVGAEVITDLEYKRIVDWDVWRNFNNYWGMDDIRKPNLNLAIAFINKTIIGDNSLNAAYIGFASLEPPTDYDLNWDDYMTRGFSWTPTKFSIKNDGTTSNLGDYCLVYDWILGKLSPGETKTIHIIYAAGESLKELENNIEEAIGQYGPPIPVGGRIISGPTLEKSNYEVMVMEIIIAALILAIIYLVSLNLKMFLWRLKEPWQYSFWNRKSFILNAYTCLVLRLL